MSNYSFIVSNIPLPEIDFTEAKRMRHGEYKKIKEEKESNSLLISLDDEAIVLIMDPTQMNYLNIATCNNPPYDLKNTHRKIIFIG